MRHHIQLEKIFYFLKFLFFPPNLSLSSFLFIYMLMFVTASCVSLNMSYMATLYSIPGV